MNVINAVPALSSFDNSSRNRLRVLVASHSHPKITSGGAEIAAFRLFAELNARADVEAWFLGCDTKSDAGRDGVAFTQPFTDREYVYNSHGYFDWFRMTNADPRLPGEFEALLLELRPDVVHLHHYVIFGVEMIWIIKRVLPSVRIIVTLHEYLAICNHYGQMVKTDHFSLCNAAGLLDCHRCYPGIGTSDFFIRNQYLRLFFQGVDRFVSPSRFLMERYTDWGVERGRISVIENIIAPASISQDVPPTASAEVSEVLRIGFFGQVSKLKGIGVLIECAEFLSKKADVRISFDIYGDYSRQPKEFQDELLKQLAGLSSNVKYRGAYRQNQVDRLMRSMDAILVPSIWWENSPVVIQEALRNRRPVICSDIGGMAEKVRDGIDGFHFSVGSSLELGHLLLRIDSDRSILSDVRKTLGSPPKMDEIVRMHLALYAQANVE
jgi:glycosyltransferase involved in cell wall biosynthesis